MKIKLNLHKLFNAFMAFNLLVNSIYTPLAVFAQEELASPTPAPQTEESPSPEPTSTPTEEPTVSPEPTEEPESIQSPEPEEQKTEESPSPEATPTITPLESQENGQIEVIILENTEASSIGEYDLEYQDEGSAIIQTDKLDYAPTDTVLITGSGFLPDKEYGIEITSDTGNFKFSDRVTSDEAGGLFYTYQLDGTYRPNYWVGIKDGEMVIAETTFTDSPVCQNDVNGVNDYSGQNDLTRMCGDYSSLPTTLSIVWNWDDAAWPGGNTGDGCSLFDTNSDGKVNYALCVTVGGDPASYISKNLYFCDNTKSDRCAGKSPLPISASTSCNASVQDTDPFVLGDFFPKDTVASCSILMSDISATNAKLIDVCSYPSQQPNSNPFDCVVATKKPTGKLEIIKSLVPSSDSGLFNLSIDGSVLVSNIGNGGTTSEQVVLTGVHTFGETAGTSTSLVDYNISAVCKNNNGDGSVVSTSGTNPWTVNVDEDEDIVCTIANSLKTGTIIVHKDVVGPHGEDIYDIQTYGIKLDSGSTYSIEDEGQYTFTNVFAGTHTIYETGIPVGSSLLSITPDEDSDLSNGGQVTLGVGETKHVYIVNTKYIPSIYGHKYNDLNGDGVYDVGSDLPLNGWTIFIDSDGDGVKDGGETSTVTNAQGEYSFLDVTPGLNIVCEVLPAGWTRSYPTENNGCHRITVGNPGAGNEVAENVDFLNYETPGLTVVKNVINNHGGTAMIGDFEIKIGGSLISFGVGVVNGSTTTYTSTPTVYPNISYLLSEKDVTGYTEGDWVCLDDDTGGVVSNPMNLTPGQDVTCTITNDDQSGSITVIKDVVPNDSSVWNFEITTTVPGAGGPYAIPGTGDGLGDEDFYSLTNLIGGTYTITEITDPNYMTSVSCNDGSTATGNSVVVDVGLGEELECTFTNTKYNPIIQVEKSSNTANITGASQIVHYDFDVTNEGDQILTGVTVTDPMCDSVPAYQSGDTNGDNKLDLTETWIYTCSHTVTLDELNAGGNLSNTTTADSNESDPDTDTLDIPVTQSPALTIVKSVMETSYDPSNDNLHYSFLVTNSGNVSLTGPVTITDDKATNESCPAVTTVGNHDNELDPGESIICSASYSITLSDLDAGSVTNHAYATADGTQSNTDQKTVNSIAGKIIIEKQTFPDGSTQEFEFNPDWSVDNFSLTDGNQNNSGWLAPGTFNIYEIVQTGWDLTNIDCVGGSGDTAFNLPEASAEIHLLANEIITCTFTNTQRGHLIVDKITDPSSDTTTIFNINVVGGTITNGSASRTIVGGESEDFEVIPGTYSVTEESLAGWYPQYVCSGIVVSAGETEYCTINNTEYGSIRINKDSYPDDEQDFSFLASGTGVTNFSLDDDGDSENTLLNTVLFSNLLPGAFTISEVSGVTGWDLTSLVCSIDVVGKIIGPFIGTNIASFNLSAGENITCTFTNTQRGRIIIDKVTDPSGDSQSFNFSLTGGPSSLNQSFSLTDVATPYDSGLVLPGSGYSVSETVPDSWDLTSATCNDDSPVDNIDVSPGETVTCTFTNTKDTYLVVQKTTIPSGDDTSFGVLLTGSAYYGGNTGIIKDSQDTTFRLVPGYTYSVSETNIPFGWEQTGSTGCSNILAVPGETNYCTFTNTQLGKIIVEKQVLPDGHNQTFVFAGEVSGTIGDGLQLTKDVVPGSYNVSEQMPFTSGYQLGSIVCDDNNSFGNTQTGTATFNIESGETVKCVFTNEMYGSITAHKYHDLNQNGSQDFDEQSLNGWSIYFYDDYGCEDGDNIWSNTTDSSGDVTMFSRPAGQYSVSEVVQGGWSNVTPVCQNLDLDYGENKVVEFGNIQLGSIIAHKFEDINANGVQDTGEPDLSGWEMTLYQNNENRCIQGDEVGSPINTDSSGNAVFGNLLPGTYSVYETGLSDGSHIDWENTSGNPCQTRTVSGGGIETINYGNFQKTSISGTKFEDENGDGIKDLEDLGVENWKVSLYYYKSGDYNYLSETFTAADGSYIFNDLGHGTYKIIEENKTGWINTTQNYYDGITLESGTAVTGKDFGNFRLGMIQGKKYNDLNNNGTYDETSEYHMDDWIICLYKRDDGSWNYLSEQNTGHTGVLGQYRFEDLEIGRYRICEVLQDGWTQSSPSGTANNIQSDEAPRCRVVDIAESGQRLTGRNFGNVQLSDIHGFKWNDVNGDGIYDDEEPLLAGWTIYLDLNENQVLDPEEPFMDTSDSVDHFGWYWFESLIPGDYQVCEVVKNGWIQTFPSSTCHTISLPSDCNQYSENGFVTRVATSNAVETYCEFHFGNMEVNLGLNLSKSNTLTGDIVDYTLSIENISNQTLNTVKVTDAFPGGFSYVVGSSKLDGVDINDPTISDGTLVWTIEDFEIGTKELTYKAQISSDVPAGTYTNLAYATGTFVTFVLDSILPIYSDSIDTEIVSSVVSLSPSISYSTSLIPQVLGLATELPGTGNPTIILILSGILGLLGIGFKVYERRKYEKN